MSIVSFIMVLATSLAAAEDLPVAMVDVTQNAEQFQRTKTNLAVYFVGLNHPYTQIEALGLLRPARFNVSITFSSPFDVCGDEAIATANFVAGSTAAKEDAFDIQLHDTLSLLRVTIESSEAQSAAAHLGLVSQFSMNAMDEDGELHPLRPLTVKVHRAALNNTGLLSLLQYGDFLHTEEDGQESTLTFAHEPPALTKGTVDLSVGGNETESMRWRVTRSGTLVLKGQKGKSKLLLQPVPENNDGTFMGQPADDTFPTMWMEWDGKVFVSTAMTGC